MQFHSLFEQRPLKWNYFLCFLQNHLNFYKYSHFAISLFIRTTSSSVELLFFSFFLQNFESIKRELWRRKLLLSIIPPGSTCSRFIFVISEAAKFCSFTFWTTTEVLLSYAPLIPVFYVCFNKVMFPNGQIRWCVI